MTDGPISVRHVIDDVARSMSTAETPALRARVVANLGRQRRPSSGGLIPAGLFALAAALAVGVHWMPSRVVRESGSRGGAPLATIARTTTAPASAPSKRETAPARPKPSPLADTRVTDPAEPDDAPTIAALPELKAMPVSEIQPKALGVPQLTVEHVATVTPLSVPALDEIDRDR